MEASQDKRVSLELQFSCARTLELFNAAASARKYTQINRPVIPAGNQDQTAAKDSLQANLQFEALIGPDGVLADAELQQALVQTTALRKITPIYVVPRSVATLSAFASIDSKNSPLAEDSSLRLDLAVRVDLASEVCCICRCELVEILETGKPAQDKMEKMTVDDSCDCKKAILNHHPCTLSRLGKQTVEEIFEKLVKPKYNRDSAFDQTTEILVRLSKCLDHYFHLPCLLNLLASSSTPTAANQTGSKGPEWLRCPICLVIYGQKTGDQPPGNFEIDFNEDLICDGWSSDSNGTLIINYHFPHGIRPDGTPFRGTYRTAYLPNCERGRKIALMLQIAFNRKVTFTVGTSLTTGQKNVVVWNSIHHKTSPSGGPTCYGYPDPTYFDRVELELAANGIYPEDVTEDMRTTLNSLIASFSRKLTRPLVRASSNKKRPK